MNYLGLGVVGRAGAKLVSSCKDLYNDLNGANLTGAVDVIAIKQPDGSIQATPFHVRFGKWGVFRTGDLRKEVEVEVNGQLVDNKMMIIESGSAFFVKLREESCSSMTVASNDSAPGSPDKDTLSHDLLDTPTEPPADNAESLDINNENDKITKIEEEKKEEIEEKEIAEKENNSDLIKVTKVVQDDVCDGVERNEKKHSLSLEIKTSLPVNIERSASQSEFFTPLSDDENIMTHAQWKFPNNEYLSTSLPDSCVLSDIDNHNNKFSSPDASTALSDSEIESYKSIKTQGDITRSLSTAEEGRITAANNDGNYSLWGKLTGILRKKKRRRYSNIEEGIYLDDLFQIDQEEVPKFFPSNHQQPPSVQASPIYMSDETSGVGSSPSLSPSHNASADEEEKTSDEIDKVINILSDISISRCGGLSQGHISEESFLSSQISFEEFCSNPEILAHPDLVIKIKNKYYGWQVAAPMIMSCLLYSQSLPEPSVNNLLKSKKSRFWNFWYRTNSLEATSSENTSGISSEEQPPSLSIEQPIPPPLLPPTTSESSSWSDPSIPHLEGLSSDEGGLTDEEGLPSSASSRSRQRSLRRKRFSFTNELTSDELLQWPLKMGRNDLVFSITTKYQGTTKAFCTLYLWDYTVKLVISDLDGTITRSDVAGQVLPLIGKDWTHNGVIELFSAISRNGYNLVYLSARAIGQSWYTKNFLRSTRRGECYLPDGPLLVAPFSLYTAFKKEVIEKIPDEFKISCLQQILSIFPEDYYPFHSGFGNKNTDVKSYHQVNIPTSRIFCVNHRGEIKNHHSLTYQTSYKHLMDLVDAQFPPVIAIDKDTTNRPPHHKSLLLSKGRSLTQPLLCEDYSSFVFWQQSFNHFDDVDLPPL